MLRLVAGIVLGYALFAFAAALILLTLNLNPRGIADPAVKVGSIGGGMIAAFSSGYFGGVIAKGREQTAGLVIGLIIGTMATLQLLTQDVVDAPWWQLGPLVATSAAAFLGSVIRARRMRVQ